MRPEELGVAEIGHFGLFHARFAPAFWPATLEWLRDDLVEGEAPELLRAALRLDSSVVDFLSTCGGITLKNSAAALKTAVHRCFDVP